MMYRRRGTKTVRTKTRAPVGFDPTPRGETSAKWRKISGSVLEDSGSEDRIARLACGDLAYLASTTRNLFTPVAGGKRFQSPYVAMGSTAPRDGAGVVRRMDYPANSALGFLCTWRDEYLERPCDRLATDARGGLCLPLFDRGAVDRRRRRKIRRQPGEGAARRVPSTPSPRISPARDDREGRRQGVGADRRVLAVGL